MAAAASMLGYLLYGATSLASAGTSIYSAVQSGKQKVPEMTPPPKEDESVKEAARREAELMKRRRGYASTIATGPQGVLTPATTLKTTLGS